MRVGISSHFEKRARRLSAEEKEAMDERTEWFMSDKSDSRLKVHALTGKLKGYVSFSISRKKRIKFKFVSENEAIFIDVGPHDDVYR